MTQHSTSAQARYVAWARKGMCTWFAARKRAVQLWQDGMTVRGICKALRVSKQWLWKWIKRFQAGGEAALRDHSSRPHRIHRTRDQHVEAVLEAKQRYPHLGVVKLCLVANLSVSHGTALAILRDHNAVKRRKKLWRKYRRFQRPYANYLWQIDITQVPTTTGPWVFIATVIDDHSRCILASRTYDKDLTQADTIQLVRQAVKQWGRPRQILTDHGCQFDQVSEAPSLFTQTLDAWGIQHIMGRPHHPRTQGKIERWHRSLKHEWFGYREVQADATGVRHLLLDWIQHYNTERPHWSLGLRTPLEVYLESSSVAHELTRRVNEVLG